MVVGKIKDEHKGILINKFIGLKSIKHCMLSVDGKESNPVKGVNTAIELKAHEDTLINKKVIRRKI